MAIAAAIIMSLKYLTLCITSALALYKTGNGCYLTKQNIFLFLVYGLLNLVFIIVVVIDSDNQAIKYIIYTLTAICAWLNLAIFWLFAFPHCMYALT